MTKLNALFSPAYERLELLKSHLSYFEAFLVGMEDDLNAVEAMAAKIEALQATIDGLEARIAAECKHSEEVWEEAQKWKEKATSLEKKNAADASAKMTVRFHDYWRS